MFGWGIEKSNAKTIGGLSLTPKSSGIVRIKNGKGIAPPDSPKRVKKVIRAANRISHTPYIYGGGHGSWRDSGYDCSGSVSFALRGGNLIQSPITSGSFESYGKRGNGKWITIYANSGHVWMKFRGGVKFDTSGANPSRWQKASGTSTSGYVIRHPKGL